MIGQLLKSFLSVTLFLMSASACFAQFTLDLHQGVAAKGKINSLVYTFFLLSKQGDTIVRHQTSKSTLIFNGKGQLTVSLNDMNPKGSIKEPKRSTFRYDAKGNFITTGSVQNKSIYKYPSKSLVYIKYYMNDKLSCVDTMKLNASGKIIERYSGSNSKHYYKYNQKGFLTEEDSYSVKDRHDKTLYSYDDNDNMSKLIYESSGKTYTTTYTYDKFDGNNNWLIKYAYGEGKLTGVMERHITYYK